MKSFWNRAAQLTWPVVILDLLVGRPPAGRGAARQQRQVLPLRPPRRGRRFGGRRPRLLLRQEGVLRPVGGEGADGVYPRAPGLYVSGSLKR